MNALALRPPSAYALSKHSHGHDGKCHMDGRQIVACLAPTVPAINNNNNKDVDHNTVK
jgi:hypothetical protein